jgi:murein DD-endopeptidase MepM/ murein hydrolase activator NlpD
MELFSDVKEFLAVLAWYSKKKLHIFGERFEAAKGWLVDQLLAKRGANRPVFVRFGMVTVMVLGLISAPIIYNRYPTSATGPTENATPSEVYNPMTASIETLTNESEKPRRDVETYEVKAGDTLSAIAKMYGVDNESIKALNPDLSINRLSPGDKIKIPPVSGLIVKVKSGETIQSLAKKYGLPSAQPIVDWPYNSFANDETFALIVGAELVIPGGVIPQEAPRPILSTPQSGLFAKGSGQFSWPTNGVITQYFAWYHNGVDIANKPGTLVSAADSGRVVSVLYQNTGYGYHVIVDHGNGFRTLYGHLSRIDVGVGDNVSRGQGIGKMGSTGRSTGPHLHFVVFAGNNSVNPLSYLK